MAILTLDQWQQLAPTHPLANGLGYRVDRQFHLHRLGDEDIEHDDTSITQYLKCKNLSVPDPLPHPDWYGWTLTTKLEAQIANTGHRYVSLNFYSLVDDPENVDVIQVLNDHELLIATPHPKSTYQQTDSYTQQQLLAKHPSKKP